MEDKTKELKTMGIDLTSFYDAYKSEIFKARVHEQDWLADVVLEPWSEESKVKFSNHIYKIIGSNKE